MNKVIFLFILDHSLIQGYPIRIWQEIKMRKGEYRELQILECAEKVFSDKGYYESQVSDIVHLAHIAKGTIYQYFSTKEDIIIRLLDKYIMEWENDVSLDINDYFGPGDPGDYALAYLRHRVNKSLTFFEKNPDRCNIILRMGIGLNYSIEKTITIFEDKVMSVIVHDFNLARRFGHISEDSDIEIISNAILGAFLRLGYYYFVLKKDYPGKPSLKIIEDRLVRIVSNSMGFAMKKNSIDGD